DQLDDSHSHPLFLAGLRFSSGTVGFSLPHLVKEMRSIIEPDQAAASLFESALLAAGYLDMHADGYDRKFVFSEMKVYLADKDFPRLVPFNIPGAIRRAQYDLDLALVSVESQTMTDVLVHLGEAYMELADLLRETQASSRGEVERELGPGQVPLSAEEVFTEQVMEHMANEGITFDPEVCHYEAVLGGAGRGKVKISGYAIPRSANEDDCPERLDLFVSLYRGCTELEHISDADISRAAKQGLLFLRLSATGELLAKLDRTHDAYALVAEVKRVFEDIDSIRIFIITDGVAKNLNFAPSLVEGKQVHLEVMDIQRLFNHLQQGRPRDEILVNFQDICGGPLPSVWVPGRGEEE